MRVLILSANTGGGHNSAAAAVREELESRGVDCVVEDGLRFVSPQFSSIVSHGHVYVYRHLPGTFGRVYAYQEHHRMTWVSNLLRRGVERLAKYVRENGFTSILCVHVFAAMMLTEAQKRHGLTVPFHFLATDYTCSPGVNSLSARTWFVPAADLLSEFVACGIPRERLLATGIPVKRAFYTPAQRAQARRRLGLPEDKSVLLLCCGSMGCGHIEKEVPLLDRKLPPQVLPVVVCGNNRALYERLTETPVGGVRVVGFTQEMPLYMAAADICVTKPGGLTCTEMLVSGCPSVLLLAVPGCESRNLEYFSRTYGTPGAADWSSAIEKALRLLDEPDTLRRMTERLAAGRMTVPAAVAMTDRLLQDGQTAP